MLSTNCFVMSGGMTAGLRMLERKMEDGGRSGISGCDFRGS